MLSFKCPGSIRVRQPMPEMFTCPNCGSEVEIWTHERMRKCSICNKPVVKDMGGASCIQWCQYAKECIGEERYQELLRKGVISEGEEEVRIPEGLKEFMKKCGMTIPGENP